MEVFERLTTEEQSELLAAAKSALSRSGNPFFTPFMWRGEMLHYREAYGDDGRICLVNVPDDDDGRNTLQVHEASN